MLTDIGSQLWLPGGPTSYKSRVDPRIFALRSLMGVLAASVTTKHGKGVDTRGLCANPVVLLSRQFVDITRSRIESLLAAFPKLRDSLGDSAKQHTLIETTSVRYLYQKIEDLFLVVITSKASNIVEDLATLQVLSRVVCV